jgi:hypothetical protein
VYTRAEPERGTPRALKMRARLAEALSSSSFLKMVVNSIIKVMEKIIE